MSRAEDGEIIDTGAGEGSGTGEGEGTSNTPSPEDIAREKGWRPKEEFEGDPEAWVDANEFVKRQPLFDKIKGQSKKLKELERTVDALSRHYTVNIEAAKAKALAELKQERREAIELGEVERVDAIDERIGEVSNMAAPVPDKTVLEPEIEQFVETHKSWFNVNQEMTEFAVRENAAYLKKHPGDLQKSLDETLKKVKALYPEAFRNQRRENPSSVDTAGGQVEGSGRYTTNRLTPEQKLVYNQLVKQHKQMTHEQYFKDLEEAGYLEK